MDQQQLTRLIEKYLAGECSQQEEGLIEQWYDQFDEGHVLEFFNGNAANIEESLQRSRGEIERRIRDAAALRLRTKRRQYALWLSAAAILAVVCTLVFYKQPSKTGIAIVSPVINDVPAGGNKATLTLADGTTVPLDSLGSKSIATQGHTRITQAGASLAYAGVSPNDRSGEVFNTVTTPRGGQYQVVLGDGTRIWLNAASSLRFPVAFTGSRRRVILNGEGYFEVAKDKSRVFEVIANQDTVQVLGTHFNVNGYRDNGKIITTLLEGRVRVAMGQTAATLEPGQQAIVASDQDVDINRHANVEDAVAWHEGMFSFNSLSIEEILQQVSRWYDVEIVYEGQKPDGSYSGKISRNTNLSEVLKILAFNGIRHRLDGRRLIIGR